MKRIRMTKLEKYILKSYASNKNILSQDAFIEVCKQFSDGSVPFTYEVFCYAFDSLDDKGFISIRRGEGGYPASAKITTKGLAYLFEYPDLENLEDPLRLEREGRRLSYISIGIAAFGACLSVLSLLFSLLR